MFGRAWNHHHTHTTTGPRDFFDDGASLIKTCRVTPKTKGGSGHKINTTWSNGTQKARDFDNRRDPKIEIEIDDMAMKTEPTEAMVKTDFGLGSLNSYNQYCGAQRYGSPHQGIASYSPYNGAYPMGQTTASYWDQWSQVSFYLKI